MHALDMVLVTKVSANVQMGGKVSVAMSKPVSQIAMDGVNVMKVTHNIPSVFAKKGTKVRTVVSCHVRGIRS
jgi:hypothetical protein